MDREAISKKLSHASTGDYVTLRFAPVDGVRANSMSACVVRDGDDLFVRDFPERGEVFYISRDGEVSSLLIEAIVWNMTS